MGTGSIQRRKSRTRWLIAGSAVLLTGLIVASVLLSRKEPDDDRFVRMFDPKARQLMTEQERQQLMRQWKNLDPETRRRIGEAAFHQAVDRFREELGKKSLEEQKAWVDGEVARMQERFNTLTDQERAQAHERLKTPESQAFLKEVFTTYHQDLSARERAVLEPLAREFIAQLETFQ